MAERTLTVRLRAVADGYNRAIEGAAKRTEEFASRAGKVTAWGDRAEDTGRKLSAGLTLPIVGAGAAVLAMAGNFEASMREVQVLTRAGGGEMAKLTEQAKRMGADTQFSASQAADAMGQLVKGGFDAKQTYEALPGVMQLAAAAGIDIASAADIATNVLSGFRLEVADLAKVNDYLAQTANASDTDVRELGEAFKYVGPVAKGANMSLSETTAVLGLFAENGIRGEMAGTALRGAITALLSPTDKAAALLSSLGVNATTSNGQLRPMSEILDQLGKSGATTGQIMELFGQRAGPAMIALLGQGSGALRKFTGMLEESGGVAQDLADSKMGGLLGSWEQFKGSIETLAITLGEAGLTSMFTGLAQGAAKMTDAVTGLPTGVQKVGLAVAGLAAASGPAIWGLGKLTNLYKPVAEGIGSVIAKLQGMRVQLALAQMDGVGTGKALLTMFGPQAAILIGLAAIAGAFWFAKKRGEEFAAAHVDAGSAAEALAKSAGIAVSDLENLTDAQGEATKGTKGFRDANREAILTLEELRTVADKQSYLVEIGYQLTLRGAAPEDAFKQVQKLAEYAGVELPVSLTVDNIGDFIHQVQSAVTNAKRAAGMDGPNWFRSHFGFDVRGVGEGAKAELDKVREAASAEWDTGNISGFIEILGRSEAALGDNANAANYLADESMRALGEGFGFSIGKGENLADVLEQVASGSTAASKEEELLARRVLDTASAMNGGLTPANIAAAASQERAAAAAKANADGTKDLGSAADGAIDPVTGLTTGLDDNAAKAEEAERAFKDYLDTLRAATDPLFAVVDAFTSNADAARDVVTAQAELDAAIAEHGRGSAEAVEAEGRLQNARMRSAKSAQDVMIASQELQKAVELGTTSLEDAKAMLFLWTSQGLITAETATTLAGQFDVTAWAAGGVKVQTDAAQVALGNLDGTSANVTVTADTSAFDAAIWKVLGAITQVNALTAVWNVSAAIGNVQTRLKGVTDAAAFQGETSVQRGPYPPGKDNNTWTPRAAGGQILPDRTYIAGEYGPEVISLAGHQPAWVSTAEQTRAMLTPAVAPGTYTAAGPASTASSPSSEVVGMLAQVAGDLKAARPLLGDVHYHGLDDAPGPAQLARDAKFVKALVS